MNYSVEFLGGPDDRWHRWAVVEDRRDALDLATELLDEKGVHAIAVRRTTDDAGWTWRTPR